MLRFLFGRAATGKSYTVLENIKQDVISGKSVVLLVPEQFTFESERTLLHTLGDKATTNVSVLSFTRLYDEISRRVGGRVADLISEYDRFILMSRALFGVSDMLSVWAQYVKSPKFIETVLATVTELKSSAITSADLCSVVEILPDGYLKNKLRDLSFIYESYNAVLGNQFLDPSDNLTRLYDNLLKYCFFQNKTVYIDAFKNFTGQQYKILDRILSQADDVIISLTTDGNVENQVGIFSNVNDTVRRITRLAKKNGCKIGNTTLLDKPNYKHGELQYIEEVFSGRLANSFIGKTDLVNVCKCESPIKEAEFAASTIRRLVREQGYRYKDFVIIARSAEKYTSYIESACKQNGVFCFFDRRKDITYLPLTIYIDTLLKLAVSFNSENIFNLLKTGLYTLNREEISELENYCYLWNISGNQWLQEWHMNPAGFVAGQHDDFSAKLDKLNYLRRKVVEPIIGFRKDFIGTPQDMVKAVVGFIEKYEVADKCKSLITEYADFDAVLADDIRQCWDIVMQLLDSMVKCLPEKQISLDEFINIWKTAKMYATVSNIPQMLDEVTFGSADRIKPSRPKVAFIIGANQDEFPALTSSGGIFASKERQQLIDNGLDICGTELSLAVDEDFLVYSSLCCATEALFVTYSSRDIKGTPKLPSVIVDNIKKAFPDNEIIIPDYLPETTATATEHMCRTYNSNRTLSNSIGIALKGYADISIEDYLKASDKTNANLSPETAKRLYGANINLSATKFDTFHRCKFSFFCKYGLNARKIQPAEFDALQRGTIVHYVLENFVLRYGKNLVGLDKAEICNIVDILIKEYLQSIGGFEEFVTNRINFLIGKIALLLRDVITHIVRELSQCEFVPEFCELKIGGNDGVVPPEIKLQNGAEMSIEGSIDRVDIWNGYVRIVDYKTGSKKFKLSDVLVGLNLQMLIYLYSILKGKNAEFNTLSPAGVLYMPSTREKENKKLTMNGIILDNECVAEAMEKGNAGEFIPKLKFDKSGNVSEKSYISNEAFKLIFSYIEKLISNMGEDMLTGKAEANPMDTSVDACKYCDFYSVCCIENTQHQKAEKLNNAEVIEKMKEVCNYEV